MEYDCCGGGDRDNDRRTPTGPGERDLLLGRNFTGGDLGGHGRLPTGEREPDLPLVAGGGGDREGLFRRRLGEFTGRGEGLRRCVDV